MTGGPFGIPKKLPPNTKPSGPKLSISTIINEIINRGSSANYNKLSIDLKKTLINNLKNIQKNGSSNEKNYINSFFRNNYRIDQRKNENDRDNLIKNKDFSDPNQTNINNTNSSSSSSSSSKQKPAKKKEVISNYTKEDLARLYERERKRIANTLTEQYRQPTKIETIEEKNKKAEEATARAAAKAAAKAELTERLKLKAAKKRKKDIAAASPASAVLGSPTTAKAATTASQAGASPTSQSSSQSASPAPKTASAKSPPPVVSVSPQTDAKLPSPQSPPTQTDAAPQPSSPASTAKTSTTKSPSQPPPPSPGPSGATSQTDTTASSPQTATKPKTPTASGSQSPATTPTQKPSKSSPSTPKSPAAAPQPPPTPPSQKSAASASPPEAEPPIKYYKKLELPKDLDTKDYRNKIVEKMKINNFTINYKSFKKYSTSNINPKTVECIVLCKNKKDDGFTKCGFKNTHIKLKKKNYENNLVISNKNNKLDKLENITGTFTICTKHFKEFLGIKMKYSKSINKIIMTAAKNFNKDDFVCGNDFLDISQFLPYYKIDNKLANVIVDKDQSKIIAKKEIKEGEELILFLPN